MTNLATYSHFHGKPNPIRPLSPLTTTAKQLLILSLALLAAGLAAFLADLLIYDRWIHQLTLCGPNGDPCNPWLQRIATISIPAGMLTMAAAIFLFLYTTGKSEENRTLAKAHRQYRRLRSRRRRRAATRHNAAQNQETAP